MGSHREIWNEPGVDKFYSFGDALDRNYGEDGPE